MMTAAFGDEAASSMSLLQPVTSVVTQVCFRTSCNILLFCNFNLGVSSVFISRSLYAAVHTVTAVLYLRTSNALLSTHKANVSTKATHFVRAQSLLGKHAKTLPVEYSRITCYDLPFRLRIFLPNVSLCSSTGTHHGCTADSVHFHRQAMTSEQTAPAAAALAAARKSLLLLNCCYALALCVPSHLRQCSTGTITLMCCCKGT